ncbi:hypothetical protein ACHAWO_002216 [Cyclotella atomus]|uniref:U6 snRNA-associated Sm-like protein LSm1 n=1 Tax=Cyclotella atomus TaxID=382360 RepID=A0ABD3NCT1_9STRA
MSTNPPQQLLPPSSAPIRSQTPPRGHPGRTDGRGRQGRGRGHYQQGRGRDSGRGTYQARGPGRGGQPSGREGRGRGPPPGRGLQAAPFGCLPPFLPGSASLVEQLDQRLMVVLRDGRHLVGTLRSFDQFGNMVLKDTSERRILVVKKDGGEEKESTICYQTDIQLGLYVLRGDVVVLMGEVDPEEDELEVSNDGKIHNINFEEFEQLEEEEAKRRKESGDVVEEIEWDFDMDLVA